MSTATSERLTSETITERPGFPLPTQAFHAGEDREARQISEPFHKRRDALLGLMGGEEGLRQGLNEEGQADWIQRFNGPHHKHGVLKAFDIMLESGRHGDQHMLMKEWDDDFGENNNYAIPFIKVGWKEQLVPAFWVICTHPEDHYRIATEQVQKSPLYGGGAYGKSFLAHIDEGEWKRRRFQSIHAVAPMMIRGYFHKMERHCHKLVDRIASGKEGTMMYGGACPEPAINLHEMVADTAFRIACDCLYGLDDDFAESRSREVRWALQKTDAAVAPAVKIQQEWADALAKVPAAKRGPLLESLCEQRDEYPDR
jgi:cytochrome P450